MDGFVFRLASLLTFLRPWASRRPVQPMVGEKVRQCDDKHEEATKASSSNHSIKR